VIVVFPKMKGTKSCAIYNDRVTIHQDEASGYFAVTLWPAQEPLGRFFKARDNSGGEPQVCETDQAVMWASTIEPFASVPDITWYACFRLSAADSYLTLSVRFIVCHFRSTPWLMANEQKPNQVRESHARLEILQAQQSRAWLEILALKRVLIFS
jgi:hypothetical protein